jgi:hypothetical protein
MRWRTTFGLIVSAAALSLLIWFFALQGEGPRKRQRLAEGYFCPWAKDEIQAFDIVYPERRFRLERGDQGWRLTSPVDDIVDQDDLDQMLETLQGQKVERWLPPADVEKLAEMGLASPRLEVYLQTKSGADTIRFGKLNQVEKRLWMTASWSDSVALVSTLLRSHFMKGNFELASKVPLAGVPMGSVESFTIDNARGSFDLVRTDHGWEIRCPEAYRADDGSIKFLMDQYWGQTIVDFSPLSAETARQFGFDPPAASLDVKLRGEARSRRIELGKPVFNLRYAQNVDRDQAFLLDSLTCLPLLESFSSYMSIVLFSFSPGQVVALQGPGGAELTRDPDEKWSWADREGRPVEGKSVVGILSRLTRLPTGRVEAMLPRQDQLERWGLAEDHESYSFRFKGGQLALELQLGLEENGRRYFRRGDYPTVYSLPVGEIKLKWPEAVE